MNSERYIMGNVLKLRRTDDDAQKIGELYARARQSAVDSLQHLIEAGQRLIAKKESSNHGEWSRTET